MEILSGAAAHVLHVARGPQRPYSETLKNPKFRKNKKSENMALSIFLWNCLFPLKRGALLWAVGQVDKSVTTVKSHKSVSYIASFVVQG